MSTWEDILEEVIQQGDLKYGLEYIDSLLLQKNLFGIDQVASLLVIRAQLLRDLDQHAAAAKAFRSAGQLNGPNPTIRLVALFESTREFVELKEYPEAMDVITLALKEARGHISELPDDRGIKPSAKDLALAESAFDPSAPISEVIGKILLLRAHVARLSQNRARALRDLSEIIETPCVSESLRAAALVDRGTIRFENGESVKAVEDFLTILAMKGSLERQNCDANYNLSLVYACEGNYGKLVQSMFAFLRSPLPPVQMKEALVESISDILVDAGTDEAMAVKEIISSLIKAP